jgi:hypothetical protein
VNWFVRSFQVYHKKTALKIQQGYSGKGTILFMEKMPKVKYILIYSAMVFYNTINNISITPKHQSLTFRGLVSCPGWHLQDVPSKKILVCCDSGLVVYNKQTGQTWHKNNNPQNLPLLNNPLLQDRPITVLP